MYAPDRVYLSGVLCFGISSFWIVLFVRSAILKSALFNRFVINVLSLPLYVKEAYLCVALSVCLSEVVVGCLWVGVVCVCVCVWIRKPLFSIMSCMVLISSLYSLLCRLYVFSLLYRNLMAAYVCWAGWLEEYDMIVSMKVGFLYMEITQLVGDLWIVMSR